MVGISPGERCEREWDNAQCYPSTKVEEVVALGKIVSFQGVVIFQCLGRNGAVWGECGTTVGDQSRNDLVCPYFLHDVGDFGAEEELRVCRWTCGSS